MSTATTKLAEYLAAEAAVLQGQSVTLEGTTVALADLDKIRAGRLEWERRVQAETDQAAGLPVGPRHLLANFNHAD